MRPVSGNSVGQPSCHQGVERRQHRENKRCLPQALSGLQGSLTRAAEWLWRLRTQLAGTVRVPGVRGAYMLTVSATAEATVGISAAGQPILDQCPVPRSQALAASGEVGAAMDAGSRSQHHPCK